MGFLGAAGAANVSPFVESHGDLCSYLYVVLKLMSPVVRQAGPFPGHLFSLLTNQSMYRRADDNVGKKPQPEIHSK